MEELTLESVNKQIERLLNEREFLLNRIETILALVYPGSTDTTTQRVDGGERIDKLLRYTELKEELQLDERLKYIEDKLENLESWRKKELARLNKYDDLVQQVVYFKEEVFIKDKRTNRLRHLTWQEIANKCYCSERNARYKYNIALEGRKTSSNKQK